MQNTIQYVAITHTNKDEAEKNKRLVNRRHTTYLLRNATFEEITFIHDSGCTIGRVGDSTNYVMIDIDKAKIPISKVREHFKGNSDYHVSYSASEESKKGFKYHIFVNLNRTITRDEYKNEVDQAFANIHSQLCVNYADMILDKKASDFYQPFFGPPAEISGEVILDRAKRLTSWVKMNSSPRFYVSREKKLYPSLNVDEYCRQNNLLKCEVLPRFDISTPHMTKGKMRKISEGRRNTWAFIIGKKLLLRILYLKHYFGEEWTKEDYLNTFEFLVRMNVVNFVDFTVTFRQLLMSLGALWEQYSKLPWEQQVIDFASYFKCSTRPYKSRKYNKIMMDELIREHIVEDGNVLFLSKDALKVLCEEVLIDYYAFVKYVDSLGLKILFEEVLPATRKRKHNVTGMSIEEFEQYCRDNDIKRGMKCQLKKKL